jgi:hypothetical protein
MFVGCVVCCAGSCLFDLLFTCSEESYRARVRERERCRNLRKGSPGPNLGCCATGKRNCICVCVCVCARARVRDVETSERDHLGTIWAVAPQEIEITYVCVRARVRVCVRVCVM